MLDWILEIDIVESDVEGRSRLRHVQPDDGSLA
jgi:hypothetical protein